MANVLKLDCTFNDGEVDRDLGSAYTELWVEADVAFNATYLTSLLGQAFSAILVKSYDSGFSGSYQDIEVWQQSGTHSVWTSFPAPTGAGFYNPAVPVTSMQFYHLKMHVVAGSPITTQIWVDGVSIGTVDTTGVNLADLEWFNLEAIGVSSAGGFVYFGPGLKVGSTEGGSDIYTDSFADLSGWGYASGSASVVADPGIAPAVPATGGGGGESAQRVGIAFDDGPLEPDPTWTFIDGLYENLVAGYDIQTGKQTELDRTDTGTGTVYLHDTLGLFDPLNTGSPYFAKLVGKQIIYQLWNPVTSEWVKEWRGKIRDYNYDIVGVLGADGKPIVANIQIECVDIFDYLGGYGLQPGVNGDTPPAGNEGIVFYEDTSGTVDDRIIQILTDVGIDSTRYVPFSGNVKVQETKYDPGDAALTALRDCADAEFPGLANIYVDRFGRFVFHGRYARFDPEGVIADGPVSTDTWDFHRWKVGDGTAITGDSDYAQIRVLGYTHGEDDIVNSAVAWPAGIADTDMPGQVTENATSITAHGKHSLPPMGDLIISECPTTGNTPKQETKNFGEFYTHYLGEPQTRITSLMVKAISPEDPRAASTWDVLTKADISDIMRTTVGYPNGVGIDMDNYIEGYTKRVRPLNPTHDYVEAEYNLTPTAWAMDPDGILAPAS